MGDIAIRALTGHDELRRAVELQQQIWGFDELELLPVRLFVVAVKIGGQVFGAFDGALMVGFCLAIPGMKPGGHAYLHSHMLGVLPAYRDGGVGRMLKLEQRKDALARGIDLMEWTFDPLEIKNAYFNIERLGAIVRRYVFNQYGATSSPLHGGLPTDRCVAEWWLSSPRVETVLAASALPRTAIDRRISVPADIAEVRRQRPAEARSVQQRIGEAFTDAFRGGLTVIGFERRAEEATYLLGKWE
ncbi:MAG TPA: acetyltransferase [Bryobacteraceae bacterium]|nr:acetyltransferase [Bryobacteraceae bacterium]